MDTGVVGTGTGLFDPVDEELLPGLLARARSVLGELDRAADEPTWPLADAQVEDALGLIGWIRHRLARLEAHLVADALSRGLPKERGFTDNDWVKVCQGQHTQPPPPGQVAQTLRVARAEHDPDLEELVAVLDTGQLSTTKADALIRFHTETAPVADPDSYQAAFATLLGAAQDSFFDEHHHPCFNTDGTPARVHGLSDKQLKTAITRTGRLVKPARDLDHEQDRARAGRSLTSLPGPCGGTEYRLVLDPEGAAVLDAALAGLSAPLSLIHI